MKTKLRFENWTTALDRGGHTNRATSNELYEKLTQSAGSSVVDQMCSIGDFDLASGAASHLKAESVWHCEGRPYFKVWPAMAGMLANTKMNFAGEFLNAPFKVFSVMFADGDPILCAVAQGDEIWHVGDLKSKQDGEREWIENEASFMRQDEEEWGPPIKALALIARDTTDFVIIRKRDVIETAITRTKERSTVHSPAYHDSLLRIFVGVAMFGVDRHELVAPDIDREVLEQRFPGGKSKGSQQIAKARIEREIAKCKGWLVGSEIDLPRPLVIRHGEAPQRGGELEFGHVRSGHMRMQPCGEGGKDRKLIFVAPTVVRPDLPQRQRHGYRIQDKLLEKKSPTSAETVEAT